MLIEMNVNHIKRIEIGVILIHVERLKDVYHQFGMKVSMQIIIQYILVINVKKQIIFHLLLEF